MAFHEALTEPARGLPYFERIQTAFGPAHDLSQVQAHFGSAARGAAKAIAARAFTFGRHIAFQESPSLHLAAHEAAHFVQQRASSGRGSEAEQERQADAVADRVVSGRSARDLLRPFEPGAGRAVLQLKKAPATEKAREFDLDELAKWPDQALRAWPMLDQTERTLVTLAIAARYGNDFAESFKAETGRKSREEPVNYYYGPGITWITPRKLSGRGYRLAQRDSVHEWWVHPSGNVVTRRWDQDVPGPETEAPPSLAQERAPDVPAPVPEVQPQPPKPERPSEDACVDIQKLTNSICDNAGRICRIADELGDDEAAQATCERARRSCEEATKRSSACGPPAVS